MVACKCRRYSVQGCTISMWYCAFAPACRTHAKTRPIRKSRCRFRGKTTVSHFCQEMYNAMVLFGPAVPTRTLRVVCFMRASEQHLCSAKGKCIFEWLYQSLAHCDHRSGLAFPASRVTILLWLQGQDHHGSERHQEAGGNR